MAVFTLLHPRLRPEFRARWTLSWPPVEPGSIVVHGASVGEGRAAQAVLEALRRRHPDRVLLRTATSDTGLVAAKGHHVVTALPMEPVARRWVDRVRPSAVVLIEAELWPCLLLACHERGVPVFLVNPRVGPGLRRIQRWLPTLLDGVTVLAVGDPKLDAPVPTPRVDTGPVLIGASLRDGDANRLLQAWDALGDRPRLLLAPRHPDRFDRAVLKGRRWGAVDSDASIVLLDTVGELAGFYRHAVGAYVGGGFDPSIGGHSAAEARAAGVPVVHGPHGSGGLATTDLAEGLRQILALGPQSPISSGAAERTAQAIHFNTPSERCYRPLPSFWPVPARRAVRADAFVISVGNLAMGGTGKTPVAAWLARHLDAPIVSRGYRGGDESRMLRARGLEVRIAKSRRDAAHGEIVILDDGFQHRQLHRDIDIVCIDGWHPTAGGVFPRGDARESWASLDRADLVWQTRGPPLVGTGRPIVTSRLVAVGWRHRGQDLPMNALCGSVHGFAGIYRPGRFLASLVTRVRVEGFTGFPDHHPYTPEDVARLRSHGLPLVTTEKDLVRFPGDAWALRTRLEILSGQHHLEALLARRRTA